ncbi:MAG TPA: hypothetical protein VH041_10305 [Caldimonas sp.]|jgi:hypothetical protein|nr:hypothetical protein [Caldimonas sp.]HEX4234689.1 hypothetical protein [Caldimonas sp.]
MKHVRSATAATLCSAVLWLPAIAVAQTSEAWQFDGTLYLYLPSVGGKTTFPENGNDNVTVDTSKILDSLQAAFMGSLGVRRGVWGAFTDYVYVDFSNSKSATSNFSVGGVPIPVDASASTDLGLRGSAWTIAGTYRVVPDPASPIDLFAGLRYLDIRQTLAWNLSGNVGAIPLPGRAGNREQSVTNWDGIVGVKGRFAFAPDRRWFVPYYLDVGTGNSDLTWQAFGGIGYSFRWGDVVGAWRYLDYRFKSGKPIESVNFNGPAIAAVFHW